MGKIPPTILKKILSDPYYKICARKNHDCGGRITFEHVFIYAGRQIQEVWSIIPICEYHHDVGIYQGNGNLKKEIHQWIALSRAKEWDFTKYPKGGYAELKRRLIRKYGKYKPHSIDPDISSKTAPQQDFFD